MRTWSIYHDAGSETPQVLLICSAVYHLDGFTMSSFCPRYSITDTKIALCCAAQDGNRIRLKSLTVPLQKRQRRRKSICDTCQSVRENVYSHREKVSLIFHHHRSAAGKQLQWERLVVEEEAFNLLQVRWFQVAL